MCNKIPSKYYLQKWQHLAIGTTQNVPKHRMHASKMREYETIWQWLFHFIYQFESLK